MANRPYFNNKNSAAIENAAQKWIEEAEVRYPENSSDRNSSPLWDELKYLKSKILLFASAILLIIGGGIVLIVYRLHISSEQDNKDAKKLVEVSAGTDSFSQNDFRNKFTDETESSSSDSTQLLGRYQKEDQIPDNPLNAQQDPKSGQKKPDEEFIERLLEGFRDEVCKISLIEVYMQRLPVTKLQKPCVEGFNNYLVKNPIKSPFQLGSLLYALSFTYLKCLPAEVVLSLPEKLFLDFTLYLFDLSDNQHPAQVFNQDDSLCKFSENPSLVMRCQKLYNRPLPVRSCIN
jgi:hypothetical protein